MSQNDDNWLAEYLDQLDEDLNAEERRVLRKYFNRVDARNAEETLRNRKVSIRQFIEYIKTYEKTLFECNSIDIEDWVNDMLSDGYAPRSARSKAYGVSALFEELEKRGHVNQNPVEEADGIADLEVTQFEKHDAKEYLTKGEYQQLRSAADKLRDRLVIELLWNTGVRVSEAVNIRLSDIDRDERSIEIQNAKTAEHGHPQYRTVYYSRRFGRTLTDWIDNGGRSSYPGAYADDSDYLLITKEGPQMAPNRVTEIVDEVAEKAGLQENLYVDKSGRPRRKIHAHLLRKSYGVHRVKADSGGGSMPLPYLQRLMGHESIETTRDRYLKFKQEDVREAERKYAPSV